MAIRVLHVHGPLEPGGIETWLAQLPAHMPADIELYYFLLKQRGALAAEAEASGATILAPERARWVPKHLAYPALLAEVIARVQPHIIHTHTELTLPIALLGRFLAQSRARLISHAHSRPYMVRGSALWRLYRFALRHSDLLLCVSESARRAYCDSYRLPPQQPSVQYSGIPLDAFQRPPEKKDCRARLGLRPEAKVLVFVGRLEVVCKGLDTLLEAARFLVLGGTDFVLLLVGPDCDAGTEVLKSQADALGISDRVRFLGYMPHPEVLVPLCAGDVFVHPSRWEGLGNSIVEAEAAGLPVVATTVGGIPEAVEDGAGGLLVPPGDPQALAEAIRWMLEHPEERRRMGEAGRRLVQERFDMRATAGRFAEVYRELADRSGARK